MRLVLLISIICGFSPLLLSQSIEWIPTSELNGKAVCADATNCAENLVCYTLAYTPAATGTLTSYTAAFRVDCDGGATSIVSNASCSMTDKSAQHTACEELGQSLLLACGNTGTLEVAAGTTEYLHQICLQTNRKGPRIGIEVDPGMQITTSITLGEREAVTETVGYPKSYFGRNRDFCGQQLEPLSGTTLGGGTVSTEMIEVVLAPNPATDHLFVRVRMPDEQVDLKILDQHGRVVASSTGPAVRSETFDLTQFAAGTYYLSVGGEYPQLTEKFVVVK